MAIEQHVPPSAAIGRPWVPLENTPEWERLWSQLRQGLDCQALPDASGQPVQCSVDDFMLMHVNGLGAHFKHHMTRCYVTVAPDGRLLPPRPDAFFEAPSTP